MGIIKRQTIKASIVTYIGVALGAINTLWLYPTFLKPEEIGLITLLTNIALMIAPLAQLGVNGIILKYYPYVKDDDKQKGAFVYLIILIPFLGYLLSMALLFICKGLIIENFAVNSPLIIDYLIWLVPLSFILVGRNVAETFSRAQFRTAMPKLFKEVILRMLTFILILIYSFYQLPQDFLVIGVVAAFGINLIMILLYLRQLHFIKIVWKLSPLKKKMIKESLIYGGYIILSGFAGMIVTKIDSWMIASKLDLANTGIFTIALYIGLAIEMPKRSLNLISLPVIGKSMKEGRLDEVAELYSKSSLIQLIVGSLLLICIWINIDDLFSLIPNSEVYIEGKYVVLFIGLAVVFDMATGVNNEIILMSNFFRWNILIMLFLIIIAIINNHLLIPIYGITGAAIATAISIFFFNVIKFIIVYVKLGIQPFSIKTLLSLIIAISVYLLGTSLPSTSITILDIGYKSLVLILIYLSIHHYLKTSEDLSKLLNQTINIFRK
jgi:O-antigen/teichoic acid export membrane protein